MSQTQERTKSRRGFLGDAAVVAGASALAAAGIPAVHAAGSDLIQVALIGCGGRGTGAAGEAVSTKGGPIKLVAMADIFENRLNGSHANLARGHGDKVDVPPERRFLGFEAYRQAMDCLKPGDVAIFATPPAFRWVHFKYAIEKGLNVFMEKPVTVDGPTTRKMLALADESVRKNLKVGVGLMCRHCRARYDLIDRIGEGMIGDIIALRAYRMHGPVAYFASDPKPANISEVMYQTQRFHSFMWSGGGCFSDFYIHNIDECCWVKGGWPVKAQATGGRHYRGKSVDQNFDNYAVEYTFGDGAKLFFYGRCMVGADEEFASYAHGSKGLAVISSAAHTPARCRIYKGQNPAGGDLLWKCKEPEPYPYQLEWDDLIEAIRQDKPFNEARRGAEASLVASMGRMSAHTGRTITYEEILNGDHEFAPDVDKLTSDGPAPLVADANGRYPVPQPGLQRKREY